jgi:PAS domain S-box-containing protein
MAELLGVKAEELAGTPLHMFIPPGGDRAHFDHLLASLGKGEVAISTPDGRRVPTQLAFSAIPEAEAHGQHMICAVVTDLTEEKLRSAELTAAHSAIAAEAARLEGEAALRVSEEQLRFALKAGRLGAWELDLPTGELTTSETCRTNFGRSPDEPFSYGELLDAVHPEDAPRMRAAVAQAIETRSDYDIEYRAVWPNGAIRWVEIRAAATYAEDGKPLRMSGVSQDVTERHRAAEELLLLNETLETRVTEEVARRTRTEEALRQSQKLEAVGQLTGGVAHDFNNLLTIIKSSTELLARPTITDEKRGRYIMAISDTVDRATRLTSQLLTFARRQALDPKIFDVAERIDGIADMLRTIVGSRIAIVSESACPEACLVEADVSQFETALVNMAVNARDAMNGEGLLTIGLENHDAVPKIRGHAAVDGRFVAVRVTDTGSGIAPETISQIFEPFFTTKQIGKGTGLGLSQAYGFAKQSGGDIDVVSEVGVGTTFILYLPRATDESLPRVVPSESPPPVAVGGDGRRVLVVEDNVDVGTFSTQLLDDLGYETVWAANAAEALAIIEKKPSAFDVVFTDVVMPGMSGVELGLTIRRAYPDLPVVLTSGYSHILADEGRHGFELLRKPYAADELSRIIARVLRNGTEFPEDSNG